MKKGTLERDFKKIKGQFNQIEEIAKHTKGNALWEHEVAVRKGNLRGRICGILWGYTSLYR